MGWTCWAAGRGAAPSRRISLAAAATKHLKRLKSEWTLGDSPPLPYSAGAVPTRARCMKQIAESRVYF